MPHFTYEAVDETGVLKSGQMETINELSVVTRLREKGLMVIEIKEVSKGSFGNPFKTKQKVDIGDLSVFSRQLAAMLEAGIPLTRALYTISNQAANQTLKKTVGEVAGSVESGMGFSEALQGFSGIFSSLYLGMIRAGEMGGNLDQALYRLSEQLQKEKSLRDNIRSATFYPAMVTGFAFVMLLAMLLFIVPIFVKMFPAKIDLPLLTKIVVAVSGSLRNKWLLWTLAATGLGFGIRLLLKSKAGKEMWDRYKFKIPVFGVLLQKAMIAQFARVFSTLLSGGIPVIQAMEAAGKASGNNLIIQAILDTCEQIQEGQSVAEPLGNSGIFPPMVIQMIAVGEETGALSDLLNRIADFYEDEVAALTKGLTALIEPLMLVFVGITVGGMVIALYLPIFTVITRFGM